MSTLNESILWKLVSDLFYVTSKVFYPTPKHDQWVSFLRLWHEKVEQAKKALDPEYAADVERGKKGDYMPSDVDENIDRYLKKMKASAKAKGLLPPERWIFTPDFTIQIDKIVSVMPLLIDGNRFCIIEMQNGHTLQIEKRYVPEYLTDTLLWR